MIKAVAPTRANGTDVLLLREIEHNQRLWHWANTEDAKNKGTEPEPLALPGEEEARKARDERELQNAARVAAVLGISI